MIGAAVLVTGLLLALAGLAAAWLPGDAIFASPGAASGGERSGGISWQGITRRGRSLVIAFLLSPIHPATWNANFAIWTGFWIGIIAFVALVGAFSTGFTLLFAGIGIAGLIAGIEGSRIVARIERRRMRRADPRPLEAHAYRPLQGDLKDLVRAEFLDENRWRDVLYVVLNFPLTVLEFVVTLIAWAPAIWLASSPIWFDLLPGDTAVVFPFTHSAGAIAFRLLFGVGLLPIASAVSQGLLALHRGLVSALLCASEKRELERRVETLKESRAAAIGVEATELRRIERDLHDGAQQRLVMLTIDLSLASDRIESDPEGARKLVEDARDQARQALAELRDLVRGIAPAILLDRGLVAAVSSIASRSRTQTTVQSDMPAGERLPEAIERAAYFVVAEALANVAKHASAKHCEVRLRREANCLAVEVWDDGVGGAKVAPGSGLEGLAGRVQALDGMFSVSSPDGGPTLLRAELPAPPRTAGPAPVHGTAPQPTEPRDGTPATAGGGATATAVTSAVAVADRR